jgi:hypothetical protein
MGVHENIGINKFPKQRDTVGCVVRVCFNYNPDENIMGVMVRDDAEEPFETIIMLADQRHVRAVECQFSFCAGRFKIQ